MTCPLAKWSLSTLQEVSQPVSPRGWAQVLFHGLTQSLVQDVDKVAVLFHHCWQQLHSGGFLSLTAESLQGQVQTHGSFSALVFPSLGSCHVKMRL